MRDHRRALSVSLPAVGGVLFSLGHSTILFGLALLVNLGVRALDNQVVCVPKTSSTSRDQAIFVDQATVGLHRHLQRPDGNTWALQQLPPAAVGACYRRGAGNGPPVRTTGTLPQIPGHRRSWQRQMRLSRARAQRARDAAVSGFRRRYGMIARTRTGQGGSTPMRMRLGLIPLPVSDVDWAIAFYADKLGLTLTRSPARASGSSS